MDWEYVPLDDAPLRGALAVVGMPSVGLVGSVATGLLVEQLGMRIVGGFHSPAMPPVAVVRKGAVTSPVQAWVAEEACGPDGKCDRLVVVRSDIAIPPEGMFGLADVVARWAKDQGVALTVGLEDYPEQASGPDAAIFGAASRAAAALFERFQVQPMEQALVAGFGAQLLLRCNAHGVPAVTLFAPSSPDAVANASVALVKRVDPLLPNIALSPPELTKQAEQVQARLLEERARAERAAQRAGDQADRSYA